MAWPAGSFVRCDVGGDCFPGERWSVGIDLSLPSNPAPGTVTQAEMDAAALQVLNQFRVNAWSLRLNGLNDASVNLRTSTARLYTTGILIGTGQGAIGAVAGTGTATHPGYVASSVTQLTPTATRAGRGRRYLPVTAGGVDAVTGQFTNAVTNNLAQWWRDFVGSCNTNALTFGGTAYTPTAVVLSLTSTSFSVITSVRADSRPDVIRGRVRSTPPLFIVPVIV